jgi:hypothetical protein
MVNFPFAIKSRRMRWVGYVHAYGEDRYPTYRVLEGKPEETTWKTLLLMRG